MNKFVGPLMALNQIDTDRLPKSLVDLVLRGPEHDRERRDAGHVAETGQLLQRLLGFIWKAVKLPNHKVDDIASVTLGANAIEIQDQLWTS